MLTQRANDIRSGPLRGLLGRPRPIRSYLHGLFPRCILAHKDSQALTGASDRLVRLFNPATTSLVQTFDAHGYEVLDLAVSDDNARFVSVGGDKQVFLWDVPTARTLRRFAGHFGRVNAVDFGGDGCSVIVSGELPSFPPVVPAIESDGHPWLIGFYWLFEQAASTRR